MEKSFVSFKSETLELLKKEDSMCLIKNRIIINGEEVIKFGTGFFLEINNKSISANRFIITCNHILDDIKPGKEIYLKYQNKDKIIKITKNRRYYTNKQLDITLIEIMPEDKIMNFFHVNDDLFERKYINKGTEIFLLQYPNGQELGFSSGKILFFNNSSIIHSCPTNSGSAGSPLILRKKNFPIIGIHFGKQRDNKYGISTSINSIFNNISNTTNIFKSIDYKEKYKNFEKIGIGNFGIVYKGEIDKENLRAIKIIDKNEMKERLRSNYNKADIEEEFKLYVEDILKNEIEIMKICMKDNINSVKFYEFYETEQEYVIVMELCDDNLQNILNKKEKGFDCDEVLDIIKQLNNTFKIMSENSIVHRDLKLQNILVKYIDKEKSKFIVKLTDYGASRKLLYLSQKCKTFTGTIITMAPEMLAGEKYDSKCDLWSLGVIIYQLFFKKYPYEAFTDVAIYNKIKMLGQKAFKKTGNERFDNLIKKLLVEDPLKRLSWNNYFNDPLFGIN